MFLEKLTVPQLFKKINTFSWDLIFISVFVGTRHCKLFWATLIQFTNWHNISYRLNLDNPTRGDALLDDYLVQTESSFTASSIVQGISDNCGAILELEWEENCCLPQIERLVPVYTKQMFQACKPSSGIKLEYGQSMVIAWRRYGIISRK